MRDESKPVRLRKPRKAKFLAAGIPPLTRASRDELRSFLDFAQGDGHLSRWEEDFLNTQRQRTYEPAMWLSDRERVKLFEIKTKLHYYCQDVPLPPIDPDGIEINDDPDGWPIERSVADEPDDLPD